MNRDYSNTKIMIQRTCDFGKIRSSNSVTTHLSVQYNRVSFVIIPL